MKPTLHGKTQGFVLRLPPQKKAHSTFMQPLQCVLQHDVANPHASTPMATSDDNNHAAMSNAITPSTAFYTRHTTTHDRNNHSICRSCTSTEPIATPNYASKRNTSPADTQSEPINSNAIWSHFTRRTIRGSVLRLPQKKANATFMQPSQCRIHSMHSISKPACISSAIHASYNSWWQPSCISFQCDLQPPDVKKRMQKLSHTGTTTSLQNTETMNQNNSLQHRTNRASNRHYDRYAPSHYWRIPFIARTDATLHGNNARFRAPASSQKKAHATFMQPLQCVLQHDVANPHASTHMATPEDNNHAAIPMRSATTDSRNA